MRRAAHTELLQERRSGYRAAVTVVVVAVAAKKQTG